MVDIQLNEVFSPPWTTDERKVVRNSDGVDLFFSDDPFRLKLQKCLTVALEQITPDDPYNFLSDLARESQVAPSKIIRGMRGIDLDDPTRIAILDEPFSFDEDLAPAAGIVRSEPYEVIIQGFPVDTTEERKTDEPHRLLADVKRRLSALKADEEYAQGRIFRIGNQVNSVLSLTFDGGVVRPADEYSPSVHFWLRVSFEVSEDHSEPSNWKGSQ